LSNIIIADWFFEHATKLDESIVEPETAITPLHENYSYKKNKLIPMGPKSTLKTTKSIDQLLLEK